jgi:glutamate-ammonia-ligase adenylyltransferase
VAIAGTIRFRDPAVAEQNFGRIRERLSSAAAEALPNLLADSPDPDAALNLLERLVSTAGEPVLGLLGRATPREQALLHYVLALFGNSQFLGETLIQNTDILQALAREKDLGRSHSREDYREHFARFSSRSIETDMSLLLARFKKREYIRIVLRDVLGIATLAEVTAEISALSDVLIEEALRYASAELHKRYGAPLRADAQGRAVEAPFAVLALGKLGGNELNYSSDIDLLYIFGEGEPPAGEGHAARAIPNREYFIRLAQTVTNILGKVTAEGQVFRIDLRLRPQGREGEPAVGMAHALRYYSERAHDWELQALIKVRHAAGDVALGREFIRGVQPRVYTENVNFSAIETALNTRDKISSHRRQAIASRQESGSVDVKLDRGGIRDIEFLVQCLQRVYGGKERWLRSGGTLFSLGKLHDKQHLSGRDFHELTLAYSFLRKVEHRLQLRRGQQVHRLPEAEDELRAVARSVMGEVSGEEATADAFHDVVEQRMAAVAEIYQRIIHSQQQQKDREAEFRLAATIESSGDQSYQQLLERLAADSPALHEIAARRELPSHTRRNLHRFLSSAFTGSERYAAILREPQAVERALRLFATSEFLTELLIRHPEEVATLAEMRSARKPAEVAPLFGDAPLAAAAGDPVFDYVVQARLSHSERLALLRQHYRHRVFAAAACDVMELRSVYDSLAEMTAAADDAIRAATAMAEAPDGFAVVALGRLGNEEFDIASDADLLFVYDEKTDVNAATRAAEQIMEALASYTREGTVFAVDPRLRPRGAEGELVTTPKALAHYFANEAQAWEALAYTKLRWVAANERLGEQAIEGAERALARFAGSPSLAEGVRAMRTRLEKSDSSANFKVAAGGFYDIDFVACYLLVRHGIAGTRGNIRERLYGLAERKLLSDADCATLDAAAELLRTLEHVIRLVLGRARKSLPGVEQAREVTERLTGKILGREFPGGLQQELVQTAAQVREVYERVVR